jgi:hypothetical protein
MNDKIRRFTTQLSDAAPLAPELDGRALPASRTPLTAMRVGIAVAVVGVLGVVALTVTGSEDRASVVPASGSADDVAAISDAIQAALPGGFRLEFVERRDSPDAAPAHAVAVNDRLEVLDIEFMALTQPDENLQPDEMSPDTGPTEDMSSGEFITNTTVTENASSGELVTDTTVECITTTSVQGAVECLQYSDEGTAVTTPPTTSGGDQPQCYTFGFPQESSSPTTSNPCLLEKLDSQEIAKSNQCTVYVRSAPDVPPVIPGCPQVTVIIDPSLPDSTMLPEPIETETTVRGDGASTVEVGTSPVYDPFGVDPSGTPSPFQGASTRTPNLYVQVAHYAINQGVDVAALSSTIASSLEQIPNLAEAITLLPEPLAPADLNMSSPRDGSWVNGSVTSGSLSVSLWRGLTDGAVIVRISYPGRLEASGNDGDVFWQALTPSAGDGRVSIVHFQRGSRDALTDADAAALTYKIADFWTDARAVIPGITQDILSVPAGGDQPPVTEAPVDPSIPDPSAP